MHLGLHLFIKFLFLKRSSASRIVSFCMIFWIEFMFVMIRLFIIWKIVSWIPDHIWKNRLVIFRVTSCVTPVCCFAKLYIPSTNYKNSNKSFTFAVGLIGPSEQYILQSSTILLNTTLKIRILLRVVEKSIRNDSVCTL